MIGDDEKRVLHLAERKGFRLERVGAAEDRYYVVDVASGAKCLRTWRGTHTPSPSEKRSGGLKLVKISQEAVSIEILGQDLWPH